MKLAAPYKGGLSVYGTVWSAARPFLQRHKRLRENYEERLVPAGWASGCDIWVQAASGGEAYLAWELLRNLPDSPISLLLTSWTQQGVEVLGKAAVWCAKYKPQISLEIAFFPFDHPQYMREALRQTSPSVVVLLETELWPGLLAACAESDTPVVVVNGRMTTQSLVGYLCTEGFWKSVAPQYILAMDDADAKRFEILFGESRVERMPNMKFDRVSAAVEPKDNPLTGTVFSAGSSVLTLGSVREEEEADILRIVADMRNARPKTCIAVCPRHMERVPVWERLLHGEGIAFELRSRVQHVVSAGSVIVWDTFGELNDVYALSRGVFVGGSLAPLGGQNFLEPLGHGIAPVIGPSYSNFTWAAGLIEEGFVHVGENTQDVFRLLLKYLQRPIPASRTRERYSRWLNARRGGGEQAVESILRYV